jgi:threonine/homoserine/homoserine lactone efflux protein
MFTVTAPAASRAAVVRRPAREELVVVVVMVRLIGLLLILYAVRSLYGVQ